MTVEIIKCTEEKELYRHYEGDFKPQPACVELDLEEGTIRACYIPWLGTARPVSVEYGVVRLYPMPVVTGEAANVALEDVKSLAERVVAGAEIVWDGRNHVARLNADAEGAEREIVARLDGEQFDPEDVLVR